MYVLKKVKNSSTVPSIEAFDGIFLLFLNAIMAFKKGRVLSISPDLILVGVLG
jgi:hypothetical protein